jgi:hypothetical protein
VESTVLHCLSARTWFLVAVALLLPHSQLAAETSSTAPQTSEGIPHFSELLAFVDRFGRPTDLGRLCEALQLGPSERDCKFHQVTIDQGGNTTKHAIGVPLGSSIAAPYVLMLQLGPLVGNIFIVARNGVLKDSYFVAKGVDYTRLPIDEARRAFATEIGFWTDNLAQLKELGETGSAGRPQGRGRN